MVTEVDKNGEGDYGIGAKLRTLLGIIAHSAPFKPNIVRLADRIQINRQTLLGYIHYLAQAGLIRELHKRSKGISALQKPDKIYLENTNMMFAFRELPPEIGTVRETFLQNQLSRDHVLNYPDVGDFVVDGTYTLEVGGKNKTPRQIADVPNAYVVADDIEYGFHNTIPLWLFGFLY